MFLYELSDRNDNDDDGGEFGFTDEFQIWSLSIWIKLEKFNWEKQKSKVYWL